MEKISWSKIYDRIEKLEKKKFAWSEEAKARNKGRIVPARWKKGYHPSPKTEFGKNNNRNKWWLGKKRPEETRRKMSESRKGTKNPNWAGGFSPLIDLIRRTMEYREWRTKVFERDNYTCQECKDKQGGHLEAHHLRRFCNEVANFLKEYDQFSPIEDKETLVRLATKYKSLWDIENGTTLCVKCHNKTRGPVPRVS